MDNEILDIGLMHPRAQIALAISRIYRRGLTTTSGGNISILDESGDIWITPSAIDKGSLRPSDIVCIKKDGMIRGSHKPSSEFPFHQAIYQSRPDIKAIIHAHPPALVSFSIVRKVPDTNMLSQARQVCGVVGYAGYKLPGSSQLGVIISKEFGKGFNCVIMENHGTVVAGSDLNDAFQKFETLEFCARTILYSNQIGSPSRLSDKDIYDFESQLPEPLPEMAAVSHPSDVREKCADICAIVRRACAQGLMIGSYGTVSARWRQNDFLITPTGLSRWDLQPKDIVQIKEGMREPGKLPSRTTYLHQQIYNQHPDVSAIILTQPQHIMAFAASDTTFDVRTIPESWIFLQDVKTLGFGSQFQKSQQLTNSISRNSPAVLIQNECILVTGSSMLQAFDYLEVAEFSAKSLILSASIGKMVPINKEQIEELRTAFVK